MKKKAIEPNYELLFQSAVTGLQAAYSDYKRALIKRLEASGVNNDGMFFTLGDPDEMQDRINVLGKEVFRMEAEVDEIRKLRDDWRKKNCSSNQNKEASRK